MNTGERDGSTSLPSKDPKILSKRTEKEKFKEKEYWDERYETEETFDWFCQLSSFEHLLFQHITPSDRILNLGCGNSSLSVSLYVKGYQNIENMDFSQTVISRMKERTCDMMPNMKWHVMDMLNLAFDSGGFDVVLDKGSMDALMVDQGDVWKPRQEVIGRVEKAIAEAFRVLKVGGRFISITFAQPHFRGPLLFQPDKFTWNLRHWQFGESFHYFFYVATKRENKETVLKDQDFDYTFPHIYTHSQSDGGTRVETNIELSDVEDENFLMNIGDVYT